jgi:hypothetical protein
MAWSNRRSSVKRSKLQLHKRRKKGKGRERKESERGEEVEWVGCCKPREERTGRVKGVVKESVMQGSR